MNKKWLTALALSGFLLAGGSAFAMEPTINVDSSTANMPNKAADPMTYVGKNSAPMLLMHGTKDFVVSPSQTDLLFQALRKEGIPSDRYLVEGAAHGGVYWDQAEALSIITDFFNKYLK